MKSTDTDTFFDTWLGVVVGVIIIVTVISWYLVSIFY
ncbi:hypothetical protein Psal006b_00575 [Piscirickettsia salmonis]|uniref:Uncharacterized protein n=1 Tax=Piscirickettsia salmonis TaxID=1238 RepID=A0AAC9EV95_PISSA|nr:hypothetical protein KU39_2617 [Piscirickettsia salmonis]OAJ34329.1 hypothetical protein A0O36_01465 [Piscirickettsiaceae bacterium NZ-RLO1]QGN97620.1 hypothetical protein Psal006b_00575 [Piscirickettsia salmonis]QGO01213.1 hypothetical protein Psal008_00573 [Piscirickettsia salmonis]QGO11938.1 hypothetical protein Psal010b_00574 [Piscirickettsia salmonis]